MELSEDHHAKSHHWHLLWWVIWSIAGIASVVMLYGGGVFNEFNAVIKGHLEGYPYYMSPDAFALSSWALFALMVVATLFFTYVLFSTPLMIRRLFFLLVVLLAVLLTTFVCSLWNVFLPPSGFVVSLALSGLGASLTKTFLKNSASGTSN